MPGFPIRTSSDQRSIDNSPRLNAALHVLHRPSMPRHPPCALNNEHTTNTTTTTNMAIKPCWREHTKHKRTKKSHKPHNLTPQHLKRRHDNQACGLMLASTIQFSHNTPHQPTTTNLSSRLLRHVQVTTREQCPRHPTMHQVLFNVLANQSSQLRCISTRLLCGGSKTFVHSTTSHTTKVRLKDTNWCHKICSLERR